MVRIDLGLYHTVIGIIIIVSVVVIIITIIGFFVLCCFTTTASAITILPQLLTLAFPFLSLSFSPFLSVSLSELHAGAP